jgi:DNA-binding PadR family transcriptional regulator
MSIKYAILGLLAERPNHGYAIRAVFEERLSDFWELNYGQVYQVLTGLEGEGLIGGRDERVGKRPQKKVYSVTSRGRTALANWLACSRYQRRPFRDDFYVRLMFADQTDREGVCSMLDAEFARGRERLAALIDRRDAATDRESLVPRFFAAAAVLHAEADLEALRQCRAALVEASQAASKRCGERKAFSRTASRAANPVALHS